MRSRVFHEAWLATLPGAILRLEEDLSVAQRLEELEGWASKRKSA